ncbi:MAG TPA: hypothetical protein VIM45_00100 [Dehalococcoidia bacterium]|jgi:hypothetical protein
MTNVEELAQSTDLASMRNELAALLQERCFSYGYQYQALYQADSSGKLQAASGIAGAAGRID